MTASSPISATTLSLAAILDGGRAAPLFEKLREAKGSDIVIDASEVARMGALCAQVLLSAQTTWAQDGRAFTILDPSGALARSAATLGLGENAFATIGAHHE